MLNNKNRLYSLSHAAYSKTLLSLDEPVSISAHIYTHLSHAHLPHALYHLPLALLLMSDHTPCYEQWGSDGTHRSEVEPLQHGPLELHSVAW